MTPLVGWLKGILLLQFTNSIFLVLNSISSIGEARYSQPAVFAQLVAGVTGIAAWFIFIAYERRKGLGGVMQAQRPGDSE